MRIHRNVQDWRRVRRGLGEGSLGFVPTMGALHAGHASLIERSVAENDISVLSIFINPTQFDDPGDLEGYPRTWSADVELAERLGVDHLIAPRAGEMYPDDYRFARLLRRKGLPAAESDPRHVSGAVHRLRDRPVSDRP